MSAGAYRNALDVPRGTPCKPACLNFYAPFVFPFSVLFSSMLRVFFMFHECPKERVTWWAINSTYLSPQGYPFSLCSTWNNHGEILYTRTDPFFGSAHHFKKLYFIFSTLLCRVRRFTLIGSPTHVVLSYHLQPIIFCRSELGHISATLNPFRVVAHISCGSSRFVRFGLFHVVPFV